MKEFLRKIKLLFSIHILKYLTKTKKLKFSFIYDELLNQKKELLLILAKQTLDELSKTKINSDFSKKVKKQILYINTLAGKGGAAGVMNKISENVKDYKTALLVTENQMESKNIHIFPKNFSFRQKYLREFQYTEGWLDFFNLDSFKIKKTNIFKNSGIVHFHNLHGNYFSFFTLPEISSLKHCIWTLHDMYAFTGHCAHSFDCERWKTGCGECPDLTIYPEVMKDETAFVWKNKKEVYDKCKITIVCPSNWLKEKAEKSILKNQDIRLIYNGIDENIFINTDKNVAREKLGLPQDKKILLFSAHGGKTNYWKGGQYLSETYEIFKNRDDILFLNIGSLNKEEEVKNWLNIPYITNDSLLALYYSAADLFIYPSLAEVFGLVVAEALACGTPVVTFKTGGIPEIVEHLKTGYVAEYKNTGDFVNGINIFLQNDELRKNAGIEGRQTILEKFRLSYMVENYKKLYDEILEKNNFRGKE